MTRFRCLLAAALALAAAPHATTSAAPIWASGEVEILVDGAPLKRLAHAGRWYVEALKGREYAIRIRNPYGVRAAVALSVDGLNTIDASESTARNARKWVLDPYETITISGWQTSRTEARRFEFTTEADSYGQALGKTANLGLITAVFFRERAATTAYDYRERRQAPAGPAAGAGAPKPAEPQASSEAKRDRDARREDDEYAATGMGQSTYHAVTMVRLDLEDAPAQTVNIRYEFRPQLVKLGILPPVTTSDPLQRRERARGFEPGFCPEPPKR